MIFGIEIASFLFLITILINYFKQKKLPLQSTKFFTAFMVLGVINIIFEALSLVTIYNDEYINSYLNRFTHQLFYLSLDFFVTALFFYIDLKCRNQKKYSKLELLIRLIPLIVGIFIIIFGSLKYDTTNIVRYSYGLVSYSIYIIIYLYVIVLIIELIFHYKQFILSELFTIILGLLSWVVISTIQIFKPTYLLSSLTVTLMVQFLYISFEDQSKYLVKQDGKVFSKAAFEITVNEYINQKKTFYTINYLISNYDNISNIIGHEATYDLVNGYAEELSKNTKCIVFLYKDDTLSVIVDDATLYDKLIDTRSEISTYVLNGNTNCTLRLLKKGAISTNYNSFDELVKALDENDEDITVFKDNKTYVIHIKDVYYIEVIDNQTFIYTKKECYESKDKLYQLEEELIHFGFERCSKSMLVNIQKIKSIQREKNSRLIATLSNDESIIISRQYMKSIKSSLKI